MTEHHLLIFMLQMAVVLGVARFFGEVFRYFHQPPLAGEILAGILVGRTVLGQASPELYLLLFPADELQRAMFGVTTEIGILFLLLVVGLEINVKAAWKMRSRTLGVAFAGVVVLVGAGVAITAITVVARLLFDLKIIKSDLGLFLVSAMALNELLGWVVLAVVLGLVGVGADDQVGLGLMGTIVGILAFAVFATTIGRRMTTATLVWVNRMGLPSPATPLSIVVCIALIGGVVTSALGVHPVFGFLLAGLTASDPQALSEQTRSVMSQMVESIFVPLFFAGICLHVDFVTEFDLLMVLAVTALSVGGKFFGAWLGTVLVGMPAADRIAVAIAHIPGGPMGVLLASVAKEAGVIGPKMFVALVIASIVSALLVGPAFTWRLPGRLRRDTLPFPDSPRIVCRVAARERDGAIAELAEKAAGLQGAPQGAAITSAVLAGEQDMGTGLGHAIAVPHARFDGLRAPLVVLGLSEEGVPWDAVDGERARIILLILTAPDDTESQLEILAAVARGLADDEDRRAVLEASTEAEAWSRFCERLKDDRERSSGST
jgi:Kef-type K+ transport system membrane component KefB/mannitol/fructose-specific phosphotransferase system IIA component